MAQQLTIQPPTKRKVRGAIEVVHTEMDADLVKAFKAECKRQGVLQVDVVQYVIASWLSEKNPTEARRLKLLK